QEKWLCNNLASLLTNAARKDSCELERLPRWFFVLSIRGIDSGQVGRVRSAAPDDPDFVPSTPSGRTHTSAAPMVFLLGQRKIFSALPGFFCKSNTRLTRSPPGQYAGLS